VRHLCSFNRQNNSSSVGAAYSDDVAPDGANKHLGILCYKEVTPTAFRKTVRHPGKSRVKSARGLAHSGTLRAVRVLDRRARVLECGGPPPLGQAMASATPDIRPVLPADPRPFREVTTSFRHIEKPFPDVWMSFPDVWKSLPDVRKSLPDVRKSLPDVRKSLPDVRKSLPDVRKSLPDVRKSFLNT
jgi:hypothetical protein